MGGAFLDHFADVCHLITISRRDRVGVLVDGGNSVECCDMTLSYTKPIPVEIDHLKC